MKKLLYKELRLCVPTQCWIYACMTILIFIPSWPTLVAFIYPLGCLSAIFPIALGNRDMLYSGLLPIKKSDIVLGKVLLVCFLELLSIAVSIPFAVFRHFMFADYEYVGLGVNFALYGFVLIAYAIFNIVYLPWYYKKPDGKNGLCIFISDLAASVFVLTVMTLFLVFDGAASFLSEMSGAGLLVSLGILAFGILAFLLFAYVSYRLAKKNFAKFDI